MTTADYDYGLQALKDHQDVQFNKRMDLVNLIGGLTNWRKNFKNNSNRTKVVLGRAKILSICGL